MRVSNSILVIIRNRQGRVRVVQIVVVGVTVGAVRVPSVVGVVAGRGPNVGTCRDLFLTLSWRVGRKPGLLYYSGFLLLSPFGGSRAHCPLCLKYASLPFLRTFIKFCDVVYYLNLHLVRCH